MSEIQEIPLEKIKVGENEQRLSCEDPETQELAQSIRRIGIIEPLVVVADSDRFCIIAGHRRFAAAKLAGLREVPCVVRKSEKGVDAEITFAENFFRKDLSPVEQASAIAEAHKSERMTVAQLADCFHRSEHWVQSQIAVCDWPPDVLEAVHYEAISVSAAANLACVTDDNYRGFLVRNAVEQGATARTTAAWLQAFRSQASPEQAIAAEPAPGAPVQVPAVPQVPCFLCGVVHLINEVSHVPFCGACIQQVRQAGLSTG